jgi:beta-galactosidase/beta-glucuronidase
MQTLIGNWKLALDPRNEGRDGRWFATIRSEAVEAPVPGNIKQVFPGAEGVAWYWLSFRATESPAPGERMLLRFGAVDYLADVWLNGQAVGCHEGGETPFTLDVTDAWRPAAENLLAVRVLSPADDPIDGLRLKEVPHSAGWQFGGIVLPVEWERSPAARIADIGCGNRPIRSCTGCASP